ncbi:MAG: hypothetical protein LBO06_03055 [Bacteroidales bacterium]|jgi:hypothetical protein|nr:hypothetical protein [Bacteroidales bacterium]
MKKFVKPFLLLSVLSFMSCVDENDFDFDRLAQTTINPTFEMSLLETTVSLSDFLKVDLDSLANSVEGLTLSLLSDQHGDYLNLDYLRYDTLLPNDVVKSIDMPNVEFDVPPIDIPFASVAPFDIALRYPSIGSNVEKIVFPSFGDSIRFDSASFLSGSKLHFNLNANIGSSNGVEVFIELTSPNLRNKFTGATLNDTIWVGGNTVSNGFDLDVSNYNLAVRRDADDSAYFQLNYAVNARIQQGASLQSDNIDLDVSINAQNLMIDVAYGYVGHYDFFAQDTVDISYFDDTTYSNIFVPGSIDLEGFSIDMSVFTNIGIQTSIYLDNLYTTNAAGHQINLLTNPMPIEILDHVGAVTPHQAVEIPIVPIYSNAAALESMPNKSVSDMKIVFNKDRPENFITPQDAYVVIKSAMTVPVKLRLNDFTYTQDVEAFEVVKEMDYLKSTTLQFYLENSFPASVSAQFYLSDSNGVHLDSLLNQAVLIQGANVDSYGNIISPKAQNVNIEVNSSKYEAMRKADKIQIKVVLNTPSVGGSQPFIRIKKEASLKMKLGVKAQGNITF